MSISPQEQQLEESFLTEALREIERQLQEYGDISHERREKIIDVRKYIWEELRQNNANIVDKIETAGDVVRSSLELARMERSYLSAQAAASKLELLKRSPYFGRIDFKEDGLPAGEAERIYIGLSTLLDNDTLEPVVYDWRSPIASMYYDYSLGKAQYPAPEGIVAGEILLKRQYKIENGHMKFMFDTGIQIGDDMLQFMLSKSSDEKMRSIVTTIQSEQNRIIRNEQYPVLVVQGAAGSGKTSIAMQRVAYLLYKYRKILKADQMILFSPNLLFSDYVSNVLPELGEENMRQTTFQDFVEHRLGSFIKLEDRYTQMEDMMDASPGPAKETAAASIRYKVSRAFLQVIRNYVEWLAGDGMMFEPVRYGNQVWINEEKLRELFYDKFGHYPIYSRLERMEEVLLEEAEQLEERQAKKLYQKMLNYPKYIGAESELKQMSRSQVRKKLKATRRFIRSHRFVDPLAAYHQLFVEEERFAAASKGTEIPENWEAIRLYTLDRLDSGVTPYEDSTPLLYLYESITGFSAFNDIRHVILDEAQDYSPFQYEMIRRLFPRAKFTLLGDLNQAIQPHMRIESYGFIEELFGKEQTGIMRLTKSYRSTAEIVDFTRSMLPGGEVVEAFSRSGDKPLVISVPGGADHLAGYVQATIEGLRKEGLQTIAVICKTAKESEAAYAGLRSIPELHFISKDDVKYKSGIVVLPVYLAKGLEFDAVIVWNAGEDVYGEEEDRKLLYTACTRAMHQLYIYHTGKVTPFIEQLDADLYRRQSL